MARAGSTANIHRRRPDRSINNAGRAEKTGPERVSGRFRKSIESITTSMVPS